MSAGGSESLADDFLHGRKLNWKNAGIAAVTAGGMLVGSTIGTLLNTTPTGPVAGIKAANQSGTAAGEATKKAVKKVEEVEYGNQFTRQNRKKVLKPNVKYTSPEGYVFKTDKLGRINNVDAELTAKNAKRNSYAQRKVGGEDREANDQGGHLIASIFGGSGNIDNLVPMNQNLNQGEWKKMENKWAKALEDNQKVQVKIKPKYKGDSQRPNKFEVRYKIGNEEWVDNEFKNNPGG
jgi:predicted ribonuclease toxin of YeeF-YezG toxin-antitoxin module